MREKELQGNTPDMPSDKRPGLQSIDFGADLKKQLEAEAAKEGHSLSTWVKHLLNTHPKRQKKEKKR